MTDALGNPVKFIISPGNEHDVNHAEELTKDLRNTKVLADKGYDSKKFVEFLNERNCEALIPSYSNSKEIGIICCMACAVMVQDGAFGMMPNNTAPAVTIGQNHQSSMRDIRGALENFQQALQSLENVNCQ